MTHYDYFTLAKKIVRQLLELGHVLVAEEYSIGLESGVVVVRNKQGGSIDGDLPLDFFIRETPHKELYRIVSRKCEWI